MNIAAYIDHTVLKQTTGLQEVITVCEEALHFGFAAVCIPPVYVKTAAEKCAGSRVKVATVLGFPFGYTYPETKQKEALLAIENGAQELDLVMNLTALKNGDIGLLEQEVKGILDVSRGKAVLKIIIESGILSEQEISDCCRLYSRFDIDFLKTSTGYAEKGASVEAVQQMRALLPGHIRIKASGGIRTFEFAKQLVEAGASRLGCSASVAITKGENAGSGKY